MPIRGPWSRSIGRHRLVGAIAACCLVGCHALSVPAGESAQEQTAAKTTLLSNANRALVAETNKFRQQHQLSDLQVDEHLQQAAEEFASYMAAHDKYGHGADGRTPAERAEAAGYQYCAVRENIAYRQTVGEVDRDALPGKFMQGWIDSPEHRDNLLAESITEMGAAIASSGDQTFYAVQLFGRPDSESYRVRLTNETGSPQTVRIETKFGADEIEMPPAMILKLTRCWPLEISSGEARKKVRQSGEWFLRTNQQGELTLTAGSEQPAIGQRP